MTASSATRGRSSRDVEVHGYRARIAPGLVDLVASEVRAVAPAHRYVIITDENVAPHWLPPVEASFKAAGAVAVLSRAVPAGEEFKTREVWADVTDWMLASGCGRDSTVVALGGGVVGDLAGFVAATFLRGVPVVQVPTTLLAMVDAAIGGKTGVDTPAGKNLVGAFHQPAAVLVDPGVLATLPPRQFRAGVAEVLKHGAIRDRELFEDAVRLLGTADSQADGGRSATWSADGTADLIARSITVKAQVVRIDEREGGLRQILNAGHTVAHAVEFASDYRYLHGEAVAIGLVAETFMAERAGIATGGTTRQLAAALDAVGLPSRLPPELAAGALVDAMRADKKVRADRLAFSLLEDIGRVHGNTERGWTTHFEAAQVVSWLAELAGPNESLGH